MPQDMAMDSRLGQWIPDSFGPRGIQPFKYSGFQIPLGELPANSMKEHVVPEGKEQETPKAGV